MNRNTVAWIQRLCLAVCLVTPTARATDLRLCTASADGNYHAAGESIRTRMNAERLNLQLLETAGSVDNLSRLASGECDAAIVQLDAYLVYQEAHRANRLELARPNFLYDEFVHLVCRRDAGIESVEDLADAGAKHSVLIGEPDSGSAATWRSFTLLDPSYASVPTRSVGGNEALAELQRDGGAACMVFVSGLRSRFTARVDEAGDRLHMVPVDDSDLDEARFAGDRIYRFRDLPRDTYAGLQQGQKKRELTTLAVGATLFVTQRWAEEHYDANNHLSDAIQRAKPAILERVAPN